MWRVTAPAIRVEQRHNSIVTALAELVGEHGERYKRRVALVIA